MNTTVYGSIPTVYTVGHRTITHPVNGKKISGYFALENGRVFQTICYQSIEEATRQARAIAQIRTARFTA